MEKKSKWQRMSESQKKAHIRSGRARGLSDETIGKPVGATKGMIVGYRNRHMPELTNVTPEQVKVMSSVKRSIPEKPPEPPPPQVIIEAPPPAQEAPQPELLPKSVVEPVIKKRRVTAKTQHIEPSAVALPPGSMRTGVTLKDVESQVRVPRGKYPPAAGSEATQCTKRIEGGWQCGREAEAGTNPLRCSMHPIEND